MSASRLHSLTAITLAALYSAVGLTGASLHYLATDSSAFWSDSQSVKTVVHYHVHGPDFHGHFHRHVVSEHHSHDHDIATDANRQGPRDAAVTIPRWIHKPHACPVLSLISKFKLNDGTRYARLTIDYVLVTASVEAGVFHSLEVMLYSLARGPPNNSFA